MTCSSNSDVSFCSLTCSSLLALYLMLLALLLQLLVVFNSVLSKYDEMNIVLGCVFASLVANT